MGSDKARITFDDKQQYRSVVMQQGRVTLEADWNEAQDITSEEIRKDALDFVGPSGTPDDGYGIAAATGEKRPDFDFSISAGTMYVGGERVELAKRVIYDHQSDWLDKTDPDWIDLNDLAQKPPTREFVYLSLFEQEVSAVEDSALRDVALGGPDTAARLRLMQHVVRLGVDANDCATGLASAENNWEKRGLFFDPATMRLASRARLELGFFDREINPNPCEPSAQGGYLGADNQLIRVQISDAARHRFTWGFDNASFLYRVNVINGQTLQLQSAPVDAGHEPVTGQAIEVLLPTARLHNGEFVAAHTGFVTSVQSYARDLKRITLPGSLPAAFGDGDPNHPHPPIVFLRVWQEERSFTPGTAERLGQTGLQVTLTTSGSSAFHRGDFWQIAARPNTPTRVYPERYLDAPQPPDGPRMWACPLAFIHWTEKVADITDCRNHFDNLVELTRRKLGGCCTVTVRPQDVNESGLQPVINSLRGKGPAKICLTPGVYKLTEALHLTSANSDLIIEACPSGAILRAAGRGSAFDQGMLVLNRADNVTLRGLTFDLPQATVSGQRDDALANLTVAIGVRPLHCQGLVVEDCEFIFPTTEQRRTLFGVAIFAASRCGGLRITRNRFIGGDVKDSSSTTVNLLRNPTLRLLVGFLHTPTFVAGTTTGRTVESRATTLLRAALENATIEKNHFERLTAAVLILGDCGAVVANENQIIECYAGFWLLSLATLLANANPKPTTSGQTASVSKAVLGAVALIAWDPIMLGTVLSALRYPLPTDFDLARAGAVKQASTTLTTKDTNILNRTAALMQLHLADEAAPSIVDATDSSAGAADAKPFVDNTKTIRDDLFPGFAEAVFGFPPTVFAHELSLSLDFSHNEVSTVLNKLVWSTALLIIDADDTTDSQVTITSNRLRSQSSSATAGVFFVNRCAVTGNLVLNEEPKKHSLYLLAPNQPSPPKVLPKTAITGNVFKGPPFLAAPRPVFTPPAPPPMNKWEFFNTMFN